MSITATQMVSKIFYVLLAICVFLLLYFSLVYPLQPIGYPLIHWQENKNGKWQEVRAPWIEMIGRQSATTLLQTSFPYKDADTLVIPRQSGNFIEVRLNGKIIHSLGDSTQTTANLWNMVQMVRLPEPLHEQNQLEIRIASSYYASGLNAVPYLCRYEQAVGRVTFLNWVYLDFPLIVSGMAFIIGLVLILFASLRRMIGSTEFFMGLALLLCVFYVQDMPFRLTTGNLTTFLWVKKGIILSGILASLCFLYGSEKYCWNRLKISRWFTWLSIAAIICLTIAPDLYVLTVIVNYTNAVLFFNILAVVVIILAKKQKPGWLLFPSTMLSMSVLQLALVIPLKMTWPLMAPYVLLITAIMFGVKLILEFDRLFRENINLRHMKNSDPLTGVMNRRFLDELNVELHDFIVMIDLDQFKEINDSYGHAFGDKLLVQFAEVVGQNLRQNDLIVRLGGDEFVLILDHLAKNQAGYDEVERILKRIQAQYAMQHPEIDLGVSYGIAALEGVVEKALAIADRRMYQMKAQKRDQTHLNTNGK